MKKIYLNKDFECSVTEKANIVQNIKVVKGV